MEEDWGIKDPESVLRLRTFAIVLPVTFEIEIGGAVGFLTVKLFISSTSIEKQFFSYVKNGLNIGPGIKMGL